MPYDIHIVRTDHWLDAASDPITKDQVDELIASDPELSWSADEWVEMSDGRGNKVTRYFMIEWNGVSTFWWYRHRIQCSRADEEQVGKLVAMADRLGARVVGDDGEIYGADNWRAVYRGEIKP
jgi:hypothetical protein